ncbi:MAG: hypothetical protein WC783_03005 [Candidatus Paceibacterota bacterium]|jgi:hypothetical protein
MRFKNLKDNVYHITKDTRCDSCGKFIMDFSNDDNMWYLEGGWGEFPIVQFYCGWCRYIEEDWEDCDEDWS